LTKENEGSPSRFTGMFYGISEGSAINLDLMGNIYRYLIYWDKQAKIYGI